MERLEPAVLAHQPRAGLFGRDLFRLDRGRLDRALRGGLRGKRELPRLAHHEELIVLLEHDVLEVVEVEFVHVQRGGRVRTGRRVRQFRSDDLAQLDVPREEPVYPPLGRSRLDQRPRDPSGELFHVEQGRRFRGTVHRPEEQLLQAGSRCLRGALGHRQSFAMP